MGKGFRRIIKFVFALFLCLVPYYVEKEKDGGFTASAVLYRLKHRKANAPAEVSAAKENDAPPVQDEEFAAEDEYDDRDSYTIHFFGLFRDQWRYFKEFLAWLRNGRK